MTLRDSPNNSSLKHWDKNTVTLGWLNMVQSEGGKQPRLCFGHSLCGRRGGRELGWSWTR